MNAWYYNLESYFETAKKNRKKKREQIKKIEDPNHFYETYLRLFFLRLTNMVIVAQGSSL